MQARREDLGIGSIEYPAEFLCPITQDKMADPVVASDGHSYEREAIMKVVGPTGNHVSPLTREPLSSHIYANVALRKRMRAYDQELIQCAECAHAAGGAASKKQKPSGLQGMASKACEPAHHTCTCMTAQSPHLVFCAHAHRTCTFGRRPPHVCRPPRRVSAARAVSRGRFKMHLLLACCTRAPSGG